ncbi:hypothetical protein CVT24_011776 [Panaeolus cyanescens]|uniref:Uncharacterized protein n=1 Tax=Panaeolus cyanescens TaxID=181874 RepID=A0A409VHJ9_9AGAR|nr:hypothetical protein CVT24_011776 [Panaeolus cyanescens]
MTCITVRCLVHVFDGATVFPPAAYASTMALGFTPNQVPYDRDDSAASHYTSTTDSTGSGPGALGGKAIKALGKMTIRGIDRVIINARLKSITAKFPHSDEQASTIKNIWDMYNVLLELCRPGLYNEQLRGKAMQLIVLQIKNENTQTLLRALSNWHNVELEILLPRLADAFLPLRKQSWGKYRLPREHQDDFLLDLTPASKTPLKPMVDDLASIARSQDNTLFTNHKQHIPAFLNFMSQTITGVASCRAALRANYLNILTFSLKHGLASENISSFVREILRYPTLLFPQYAEEVLTLITIEIRQSRFKSIVAAIADWKRPYLESLIKDLEGSTAYARVLIDHNKPATGMQCPFELNLAFLIAVARLGTTAMKAVIDAGILQFLQVAQSRKYSMNHEDVFFIILEILKSNEHKLRKPKARSILTTYIARRETAYLLSQLSTWDEKSLEVLLHDILRSCIPIGSNTEVHHRQTYHSRDGLYHFDQDRVVSVVVFSGKISKLSVDGYNAVIKAGVLDTLLAIQAQDLSIHSVDAQFNFILNVLKPGNHPHQTRKQALDLLVFQVCRGEDQYLLPTLEKWTTAELNRLICELSAQFPPMCNKRALEELFKAPKPKQKLSATYLQRLLSFMACIAKFNDASSQLVLQTGFMDVLLALQKEQFIKEDTQEIDELVLLILQKPRLHDNKVMRKALSYLSSQVEGESAHILKYISRKPVSDIQRLVSGMLEQFSFDGNLILHPNRTNDVIKQQDIQSLNTCVLIFSKVILKHRFAFQALINAGILDIIIAVQERGYTVDKVKGVYDIILTSIYLDTVSDKSLKILAFQIMNDAEVLTGVLKNYSAQEFGLVFPAILQGLKHALSLHQGHVAPCPGPDRASIANSIVFLKTLYSCKTSTAQHMLDVGFLDLLLSLYPLSFPKLILRDLYEIILHFLLSVTLLWLSADSTNRVSYRNETLSTDVHIKCLDFLITKIGIKKYPVLFEHLYIMDSAKLERLIPMCISHIQTICSEKKKRGTSRLLSACITFIANLCRINASTCQIVLNTNILDFLLSQSHNVKFQQTPHGVQHKISRKQARKSEQVNVLIRSLLIDIFAHEEHRETIISHPLYPEFPHPPPESIAVTPTPTETPAGQHSWPWWFLQTLMFSQKN